MTVQLHPLLTFDIEAGGDRFEPESEMIQGDGTFTALAGDICRVVPVGFELVSEMSSGRLVDLLCESDGYDDEDLRGDVPSEEPIRFTDVDAAIVFMALAVEREEPLHLEFETEGSAFWLFHDVEHVKADTWIDLSRNEGGVSVDDGSAEENASVEAALHCFRTGIVSPSEVFAELSDNGPAFEERFGYRSDAVRRVFNRCKLEATR